MIQSSPKLQPTGLLCVTYKRLERFVLNRIALAVESVIQTEQIGFHPKPDCSN